MERIEEAENIYKGAVVEFLEAKGSNDELTARDAASKAYLALVKASEGMFLKKGLKEEEIPKTYRGLRYFLIKFGSREQVEDFYIMRQVLHIDAYYDGLIDFDELSFYIGDILKEYIEKIKNSG